MEHTHNRHHNRENNEVSSAESRRSEENDLYRRETRTIALADIASEKIRVDMNSASRFIANTAAPEIRAKLAGDIHNCYSPARELANNVRNIVAALNKAELTTPEERRRASNIVLAAQAAIQKVQQTDSATTRQILGLQRMQLEDKIPDIVLQCQMKLRTTSEDFINAVKRNAQ
jgi:hypothetical protein